MTLKDYTLMQTNRPIDVLTHWRDKGYLELNPPYQRGDVWGKKRRRNLIKSVLMGIPIPSLIINDRFSADFPGEEGVKYAVIDGKQRITAILMFLDNRLSLPWDWFDVRHLISMRSKWVFYSDLNQIGRRMFTNCTIAVSEARFKSIEEEREVFDLVNFGGLAQGELDSDRDCGCIDDMRCIDCGLR